MIQLTRNEAQILLWVCEDMLHYSEGTYPPSSQAERCGFGKKLLEGRMEKEDVVNEQEKADRELGALVRRMAKDSSLVRHCDGSWGYRSPGSRTDGFPDPEGALLGLRETFAERWLRHYDDIGWAGRGLGELRRYALMECGRESELAPPQ